MNPTAALAGATPTPYWLDDAARPDALPALRGPAQADLAIVGGGYLGLWTALLAKQRLHFERALDVLRDAVEPRSGLEVGDKVPPARDRQALREQFVLHDLRRVAKRLRHLGLAA